MVVRYRTENRRLQRTVSSLSKQLTIAAQSRQTRVADASNATQTASSFLRDEDTMKQQVLDMQRRLDRLLIELQANATTKYDRQLRANHKLQQNNQDLSVRVASLEQQLRQAEGRVHLLRQQLLERTPRRGPAPGAVKPRDFQQWMTERDELMSRITLLTDENKVSTFVFELRLKGVLKKSMQKYKRLQTELSDLSPSFFQELEDLKFELHQARLRNRELEAELADATATPA
ncbi:hypothetical protein PTSG_09694 [Salpingoeca rosetta]|uniref:Uncharacterized protein n=1 Tax=Salpingoeca rosetta (strain ATCC 50818 / BSB-021) TaxID=946362 RepID=F2UNS2_SALR5|nr:uncharacterized protein PTSG_09694 [Salpingoeca rosetta]EGD79277.1 hypothetical protein PTSG_09694 [Salpingoeca rosetta]|eukprot:XP_004989048.1 hypothetical protein PTSG_09694 [Salpingoeca rosetta]